MILRTYSEEFVEMLKIISGYHEKTGLVVMNCLGYFLQTEEMQIFQVETKLTCFDLKRKQLHLAQSQYFFPSY